MCYHVTTKAPRNQIEGVLQVPMVNPELHQTHFHANGFAHPLLPAVSVDNGVKGIHHYKWGLIPPFIKSLEGAKKLQNQTLNAKSETIFEKPSFRSAIMKHRCVIPVDGFFEWKHVGKEKIPYWIHPKEHDFFLLAAIYEYWKPMGGEWEATCSIITTEANELMADIHNSKKRMPLMIDQRNMNAWIDPDLGHDGIVALMQPCDDNNMAAYTVSKDLANPKVNTDIESILTPIH